jgi:hypothetical protein
MKQKIALISILLLTISCSENVEKRVAERLELAQQAFEQGNYSEAKIEIDSIKILYPKAFKARKEANRLLQQVEKEEAERGLTYLDSMLQVKQAQFEAIKAKYTFEKNAEYQKEGNYFWPTQTVEKNLHRSYLRFQVSERGVMTMTSIYCGASNIHHTAVRATDSDGSFAQTPPSNDRYETTDLGERIEKADYKAGQDGDLIGFLYINKEKSLRVEYLGNRRLTVPMSAADRQSLTAIYELTQILAAIEQIKQEQQETKLKIEFFTRRMQKL